MEDKGAFLEGLYKEYNLLNNRLAQLTSLIITYGGRIPNNSVEATTTVPVGFMQIERYPIEGTWKDKIIFILRRLATPSTVDTIQEMLHQYEPHIPLDKLASTLRQYCSIMGKEGEISVDPGYRNKYFLNKN